MRLLLGPKNSAYADISDVETKFGIERGRILVAWARVYGVGLLQKILGPRMAKLEVVVGLSFGGTSAEALMHLHQMGAQVRLFHKHPRQTFHPKIYCFDSGGSHPRNARVLVGSSNLTGGGLFSNYEGNLTIDLQPRDVASDATFYESVMDEFDEIVGSDFCTALGGADHIKELLESGFIATETRLRQKAAKNAAAFPRLGKTTSFFTAPPPEVPKIDLPALPIDFTEEESSEALALEGSPAEATPEGVPDVVSAVETLFVRTLTSTDVKKLKGASGTFEPDLAITVRDTHPDFWGWPGKFASIDRGRGPRLEWATSARLITSLTGEMGRRIDFVQWFREEREGHAPEHRLRLGPISQIRDAVPPSFDAMGVLVVERCDEGSPDDFIVRLIASDEQPYADFASRLTGQRAKHRFGYASSVGDE
ncbi:phospholipase D family protein [Bosea sp. TWI1241]|uniref:phospholipase D family protein n=1 Tax=Bosea sp. TWI1241 TaxID=3148904 RepID=UPI0032088005